MKKLLFFLLAIISVSASAQLSHSYKDSVSKDEAFVNKVKTAAYSAAISIVADTVSNANVKRFSQTVIKEIVENTKPWAWGLGYYLMSIPATVTINAGSSQNDIDFGMPFVYTLFAKAWYSDISN